MTSGAVYTCMQALQQWRVMSQGTMRRECQARARVQEQPLHDLRRGVHLHAGVATMEGYEPRGHGARVSGKGEELSSRSMTSGAVYTCMVHAAIRVL